MSTRIERQIQWRRSKVAELDSQGHSQPEMASILQVSIGTVNGDLSYLRQQAKSNIRRYIHERLPEEYERCLVGLQNKPFWIWNIEEHKLKDVRTKGQCCFNHIIGLPTKDGLEKPIFDYQQLLYEAFALA